jgi:hypothetical protein
VIHARTLQDLGIGSSSALSVSPAVYLEPQLLGADHKRIGVDAMICDVSSTPDGPRAAGSSGSIIEQPLENDKRSCMWYGPALASVGKREGAPHPWQELR